MKKNSLYQMHPNNLEELFQNLDSLLADGRLQGTRVAVFGTNKAGGVITHYLQQKGIRVDAILDSHPLRHHRKAYDVTIVRPDEFLQPYRDDTRILFATYGIDGIIKLLEDQGYRLGRHIFPVLDARRAGNDYTFLSRSGMTPATDEEIRQSMLRSVEELDRLCTEHGLRYFLSSGTLLGAVRHQGFIPWDDDADLYMPVGDIIKLSEIMKDREDFSLINCYDDEDAHCDMLTYITDNRYVCDCMTFPQISMGLPVDIFTLIGMPKDEEERERYSRELKALDMEGWCSYRDEERRMELRRQMREKMLQYDFDTSDYVTSPYSAMFYEVPYDKAIFSDYTPVPFEGRQFRAPVGYDALLKRQYGDYMQLPPESARTGGHEHRAYHRKPGDRG